MIREEEQEKLKEREEEKMLQSVRMIP